MSKLLPALLPLALAACAVDETTEACTPADEIPSVAPTSQERRAFPFPEGGSRYDPRLAGCSLNVGGIWDGVYDDAGRLVRSQGIDSGARYTWDDAGCLSEEEAYGYPEDERTIATTCDHHGFPICVEDSRESAIETFVNAYVGDELVETVAGTWRETYAWADGKLVALTREEDGVTSTTTAEWVGDVVVAQEWTRDGERLGGWTSTLDELDRITTRTVESSDGVDTYTWVYEDEGPVPTEIRDDAGDVLRFTWASCP